MPKDADDEHARYAAFKAILSDNATLDDDTIDRYIMSAAADEDHIMAQAALIDLLAWSGLTDRQFVLVCARMPFDSPTLQRIKTRYSILRELRRAEGFSDDLMHRIIESNDAKLQREALNRWNLPPQYLNTLSDRGATRAVRNIATSKMKSRRILREE